MKKNLKLQLMKNIQKLFLVFILLSFLSLIIPKKVKAFLFISWGDTKSGTSTLSSESNQAKTLNPKFTIYAGDLVGSWSISGMNTWVNVVNGSSGNGMKDITFPVRGNHDKGASQSEWSSFFNQAQTVSRIGGSHYSELTKDQTYSFDYENSHIVGIDVLGDVTNMSSAQITWLDNDLAAAENRGLTHAFLFWHGPVYALAEHCCPTAPSALINVLNKHKIVSATFHGHEHVTAYTHINSSRISGVTHEFEEFVTGDAGAGPDSCKSGRFDYCLTDQTGKHGFAAINVSGNTYTVSLYALGSSSPQKTYTFSNTSAGTGNPTQPPVTSPPPTGTGKPGDADGNGIVDGKDYVIWLQNYNQPKTGPSFGDFDNSTYVDGVDYVIWRNNYLK